MPYTLPLVCGMFLVVIGLPVGLYRLLTRSQRRFVREIRQHAEQRRWTFHKRQWTGSPTDVRIEGQTASGIKWILTTKGSGASNRGWSVGLHQRFPSLAGETDVAIALRDSIDARLRVSGSIGGKNVALSSHSPSKIAAFSGTAAGVLKFFEEAQEVASGNAAFDKTYRVLMIPDKSQKKPVDPALADSIINWPASGVAVHSTLFWRDPFGFHAEAGLVAQPNWATIEHLVAISEALIERIPQSVPTAAPSGIVDRLVAGLMR